MNDQDRINLHKAEPSDILVELISFLSTEKKSGEPTKLLYLRLPIIKFFFPKIKSRVVYHDVTHSIHSILILN